MRKTLSATLVLVMFNILSAQDEKAYVYWKIDSMLSANSAKAKVIGSSLVLVDVKNGDKIFHYGNKNLSASEKVTDSTLFRIASCTKTFTAIAIMQLVEKGIVKLDEPLETYLPELKFRRPPAMLPITVHHLLTHTSGLRDEIKNGMFTNKGHSRVVHEDIANDTLLLPPMFIWAYSNAGYGLLGNLIERVTGKEYSEYIRESIFTPLGMTDSGMYDDLKSHPNMSMGYRSDSILFSEPPVREQAAGDIVSSPRDMALFMRYLLGAENIKDRLSMNHNMIPQMMADKIDTVELSTGEEFGYGFFIQEWQSEVDSIVGKLYGHKGDTRMFHSIFFVMPKLKVGVAIHTNSENGDEITNKLLVDALKYYVESTWNVNLNAARNKTFEDKSNFDKISINKLVGKYDLGSSGFLSVKKKGKKKLKLKTSFDSPVLVIKHNEQGFFSVKAKLFKLIPVNIKSLAISFEMKHGKIYMKQKSLNKKTSSYIGMKLDLPNKSHYWDSKIGRCEVVNLVDGSLSMVPTYLDVKDSLIYLKVKDPLSKITQDLIFQPVSKEFAVHYPIRRGIGNYIKVLGNGNLYYSGYEISIVR
jgi:CubicO group peptidase (beta-lactamase class C family)